MLNGAASNRRPLFGFTQFVENTPEAVYFVTPWSVVIGLTFEPGRKQ